MLASLLLAYRVTFWPIEDEEEWQTLPDYFTFQANGTFSIAVSNSSGFAEAMICTSSQYAELSQRSTICPLAEVVKDVESPWEGTISTAGRYQVLLHVRETLASVTLRNPTSFLDAARQPCLITKPTFAILLSALFLSWTINWVRNFSLAFTLHTLITVTIGFSLIATALSALEFKHCDSSDEPTPLTSAGIVTLFASDTMFCWTTILIAKGWSLVKETLGKVEMMFSFFASVFLTVPLTCIANLDLGIVDYVFLVAATLGLLIYYRAILKSVDASVAHVIAHLIVIAERGIDPRTTPIWQKYRLFRSLLWGMVVYFALQTLAASLAKFTACPYYATQLIRDCTSFALMAAAAVLFRLRQGTRNGYMTIGTEETPQQFRREDIGAFSVDSDQFQSAQIPWEVGMALPPQPILAHQYSQKVEQELAELREGEE
jgi:hypothetical protein